MDCRPEAAGSQNSLLERFEEFDWQHAIGETPWLARERPNVNARPVEVVQLGDNDPRTLIVEAKSVLQAWRNF